MPDGGGGMAAEPAGAAGFKGMVGLPVSGGGLGGVTLLSGLVIGAPPGFGGGGVPESGRVAIPDGAAGADGGATGGRGAAGGVTDSGIGILEVSFFGTWPTAGGTDVPGTLIRTVSLLIEGCSVFGGRVIRMVSFLVESSSCMFGWSAMVVRGGEIGISASHSGVNGVFGEIPVQEGFQRAGGQGFDARGARKSASMRSPTAAKQFEVTHGLNENLDVAKQAIPNIGIRPKTRRSITNIISIVSPIPLIPPL